MKNSMRVTATAMLATALIASGAYAADIGALPAGKPATVKQAQAEDNTLLFVGLGVVAVGIAVAASSGGSSKTTPATTSTQ